MEARPKPRRTPTLAVLGFHAALLMAPIAALGSVATYTPRTEAESLLAVAAFAVASLVLLALSWRCLPRLIRVSACSCSCLASLSGCSVAGGSGSLWSHGMPEPVSAPTGGRG